MQTFLVTMAGTVRVLLNLMQKLAPSCSLCTIAIPSAQEESDGLMWYKVFLRHHGRCCQAIFATMREMRLDG